MIEFGRLVWYTKEIRNESMRKIQSVAKSQSENVIMVGFGKPRCGVLNIVFDHPGMFKTALIFDAPLATEDSEKYELRELYRNDAAKA